MPRDTDKLALVPRTCRTQEETLASKAAEAKIRAEAIFKKRENQARQAATARTDYENADRAVSEKTQRLRLLRLAKEAAEAEVDAKAGSIEL
jgi:hypothetical protein